MAKPLKVLYYNTFLPVKYGEGILSRQFLRAANQLDKWQIVPLPATNLSESLITNGRHSLNDRTPLSGIFKNLRRLKSFFPADTRKWIRRTIFSPTSPLPLAPYLYRRRMNKQLQAVLAKEDPFDVLLLRTSQADLGVLRELCKQTTKPIVIEGGGPLAYQADHVFHRAMSRQERDDEYFLYEMATAVIVISEPMKSLLVKEGIEPNKIVTIPNGVDFSKFTARETETRTMRQKLGLEGQRVVGYVGGFWRGHDVHTLLKAWQRVEATQLSNVVLMLVGDGPMRMPAQALCQELGLRHVHWAGRVQHDEVPAYMSIMDVAVAPYYEAPLAYISPLKVIEYLAMGLPIVATHGGQITELIEHGRTGYLYPAGSAEALSEFILCLLNGPDEANEMGRLAQLRIQKWYSWDSIAQQTFSICEKATN